MVLLVTNKGKECTRNWKKPNPTARPSAQVTMKTESQRFSTTAGFKLVWNIFSKCVPAPTEGSEQVPKELTFEAFYSYWED